MRSYRLTYIIILLTAILVQSCSGNEKVLIINNPSDIDRPDDLVVIKRSDIEKHIGRIVPGKFACILQDSLPLPVQYDDMNNDGEWDELCFLYSFKAGEAIRLSMVFADTMPGLPTAARAHVNFRRISMGDNLNSLLELDTMPQEAVPTALSQISRPIYQNGGPLWQNEKCAFRLYTARSNTKDVIAKETEGLIPDTTTLSPTLNILHIGKSLGAGSIAVAAKATNGIDTLIRVGGKAIKSQFYQILANGPLRAVFRMKYEWEINGRPVHIVDETSIWGGQYFYESKVYIEGTPLYAQAVTGFPDYGDHIAGQINIAGSKIFYSYGRQAEQRDNLGLAIAIDDANYGWFSGVTDSLSDIQNSYLVSQKFAPGEPVVYRFYSCWGIGDGQFKTEGGFQDYLKKQAILFHQKLVLEWK